MESTKNIFLYIENHGLSLVIIVMLGIGLWRYVVPYIKKQTETMETIKTFFENHNKGVISGKALELMLELQAKALRWSIENKYIFFIQNNNIKNRYSNIIFEIDNYINVKMLKFEDELKDITDKIAFKVFSEIFQDSVLELKKELDMILQALKEEQTEQSDYEVAKRTVRQHAEHFQNNLIKRIKELTD
nr:MAG TPA: hypothetical protein [Caudoviricetes sp.]